MRCEIDCVKINVDIFKLHYEDVIAFLLSCVLEEHNYIILWVPNDLQDITFFPVKNIHEKPMNFGSNGTSFPCRSKVECEIVGSKLTKCVCNLPIKNQKNDIYTCKTARGLVGIGKFYVLPFSFGQGEIFFSCYLFSVYN